MVEPLETWNMAKAYLMRLDGIMQNTNQFSKDCDCYAWFMELLSHYRELYPKILKLKNGANTGHINQIKRIKGKLNQAILRSQMLSTDPNYSPVYEELHKWDMMLKKSMEDLSLLTPATEDPRFAMASR